MMGRPGNARFLHTIRENHILNCPITVNDKKRAELIYGKDVAFLKGKTTASPAKEHVPDFQPIPVPTKLLSLHTNVTLGFDVFYVLEQTFSLSTSRNLLYVSCRPMPNRTKSTHTACINADLKLYSNCGFLPVEIHANGE
jgi:hypothetical protein